MKFHRVSLRDAIAKRREVEEFLNHIDECCEGKALFEDAFPLKYQGVPPSTAGDWGSAIVHTIEKKGSQPLVTYRQGGDDFLLIDYGHGAFDLNYRCRAVALYKKLREGTGAITFSSGLHTSMACGNSLMLYYDGLALPRSQLLDHLTHLESALGDLSTAKMPSRRFRLPLTFSSAKQEASIQRYMKTQRPYAAYLPDTMNFITKNNAFSQQQFRDVFLNASLMMVAVGFFTALPLCLPIDPRQRMNCPKMNPSRVFTPDGQVSWGGSCMAVYNVESPGGYMPSGMSIPGVDILGSKSGYSPDKPWLFEVEEEYERFMRVFHSGRYGYEWEDVVFDLEEHNRLLRETKGEVEEIRKRQSVAQEEMGRREKEMLERWDREKEGKLEGDVVEELLNGMFLSSCSRAAELDY